MAKKQNPSTSVNKEIYAHAVETMSQSAMPQAMRLISEILMEASKKQSKDTVVKAILRSKDMSFAMFDRKTGEPVSKNFAGIRGLRVYFYDPENPASDQTQFNHIQFENIDMAKFRQRLRKAISRSLA
jgi:hypothetical protein